MNSVDLEILSDVGFGQIETICKFFRTGIVVLSKIDGDTKQLKTN